MPAQNIPKVLVKAYLSRYPIRVRWQQFNVLRRWVWMQPILEELQAELFPPEPVSEPGTEAIVVPPTVPLAAGVQQFDSPYRQYRCVAGDSLRCDKAQSEDQLSNCSICGFPSLLPSKGTIVGQRGSYQIGQWNGRRGIGRLYDGVQLSTNEAVMIKEYLLPSRYFNAEEIRLRKAAFKQLTSIGLADGRSQDFRFLMPIEAVVDEQQNRCYLILSDRYANPTLNQRLTVSAFSDRQVQQVLNQVLQSLELLHVQKFRFPNGQVESGLIHNNLSLDSLLVRQAEINAELTPQNANFLIDLCDLGLWEQLFEPLALKRAAGSVAEDLAAIGYISFCLLAGRVIDDRGHALDPRIQTHWRPTDPALRTFILRLLGIETPFESAAIARQELLRLPRPAAIIMPDPVEVEAVQPRKSVPRWLILLLSAIGIGALGWLLLPKPQLSKAARPAPAICCLNQVNGIPEGTFTYTSVQDGIWRSLLQQPDLIAKGQTLQQRLQAAQPKLNLSYTPAASTEVAIAQVQSGQAAFAVVPLIQPLPDDLQSETIAYDGLAVFVAFSYSERDRSLPKRLNGELSLEQIRQIYQGSFTNWQQLGSDSLAIERYQPLNREAIAVFNQRVAQANTQIAAKSQSESEIMRSILRDFEVQQVGSIGFGSISKIVGQCSIYSLALKAEQRSVQAIVFAGGSPITATTDLCSKKGSYRPDINAFRSGRYPLAYAIAVVYPRRNDRKPIGEKFAALFKTREGQRLLSQVGLVPLEPLP